MTHILEFKNTDSQALTDDLKDNCSAGEKFTDAGEKFADIGEKFVAVTQKMVELSGVVYDCGLSFETSQKAYSNMIEMLRREMEIVDIEDPDTQEYKN